ncbi:hypothetical protein JCM3770_001301 [Rhodotorula araucariae]
MLFFFDDNTDGAITYSTAAKVDEPHRTAQWTTYVGDKGAVNATRWYGGSFHSCSASSELSTAAGCNATITFSGTRIWVIGDWNPVQGSYYCALLDEHQPWRWYNGSTLSSPYGPGQPGLNHTRCELSGLEPDKQHTLVFGQTYDGVAHATVPGAGITIDYYAVENASDSTAPALTWASDFIAAEPDAGYEWSIRSANSSVGSSAVSSITSAPNSAAASSSATEGPSSSRSAAVGIGVGVSVGCVALLALLAAWWFLRRHRRADDAATVITEPHHELKSLSPLPFGGGASASASDAGGFVPYRSSASGYGPSQYGLPHMQELPNSHECYTPSMPGGSNEGRLDSPATFRPRGS